MYSATAQEVVARAVVDLSQAAVVEGRCWWLRSHGIAPNVPGRAPELSVRPRPGGTIPNSGRWYRAMARRKSLSAARLSPSIRFAMPRSV